LPALGQCANCPAGTLYNNLSHICEAQSAAQAAKAKAKIVAKVVKVVAANKTVVNQNVNVKVNKTLIIKNAKVNKTFNLSGTIHNHSGASNKSIQQNSSRLVNHSLHSNSSFSNVSKNASITLIKNTNATLTNRPLTANNVTLSNSTLGMSIKANSSLNSTHRVISLGPVTNTTVIQRYKSRKNILAASLIP
jgi:hypothetical protein